MKKILAIFLMFLMLCNIGVNAAEGIYTWQFSSMEKDSDSQWIDVNTGEVKKIASWGGSLLITGSVAKDISSLVEAGDRIPVTIGWN